MKLIAVILQLTLLGWATGKCRHAEHQKGLPPVVLPLDESDMSDDARLLATKWRKMRFMVRYVTVVGPAPSVQITDFFKLLIIPRVIDFLSATLSVSGPMLVPRIPGTFCGITFGSDQPILRNPTNTDFILFVGLEGGNSHYDPWVNPCLLDPSTMRPTSGVMFVSTNFATVNRLEIERHFYKVLHAMMHMLALHESLIPRYPIGQENVLAIVLANGAYRYAVKTPGVVAAARAHFNCPSLEGVLVEDEGSDQLLVKHWEKTTLGNDILTNGITGRPVVSNITLNLLNDVGWYSVNFASAERLFWGQGRGCAFVSAFGSPFPEFAPIDAEFSCTADFLSKSGGVGTGDTNGKGIFDYFEGLVCNKPNFSSSNWFLPLSATETSGASSRCFAISQKLAGSPSVTVKNSMCTKSFCVNGQVIFTYLGKNYTCTVTGQQVVLDANNTVTCPSAAEFCKFRNQSPLDDCNGRGTPLANGNCRCEFLYSGPTCATVLPCPSSFPPTLCQQLLAVTPSAFAAHIASPSASSGISYAGWTEVPKIPLSPISPAK